MAQVSVIVPVYNVEEFLPEALESLKAQTLEDIEIVAVDDGSTDGSLALLKRAAEQDTRIVIVSKPNGGLSSARNAGIAAATSPIVCFLDADDLLTPDACRRIADVFEQDAAGGHPLDVLVFGAECLPREAAYPWLTEHLSPRDTVYEPFAPALLFEEMSLPFSWRLAIRKAFLEETGIAFDEGVAFGEDQVFGFALYPRANRTRLIGDKLYEYRVSRPGSLMDRVAHEPVTKCTEHVKIARHIFEDGDAQGYLHTYAPEMLSWLVEFVGYEALGLPPEDQLAVLGDLSQLIRDHWTSEELHELPLGSGTRAIIGRMVNAEPVSHARARALQTRYGIERHGLKSAVTSRIGKLLGRDS